LYIQSHYSLLLYCMYQGFLIMVLFDKMLALLIYKYILFVTILGHDCFRRGWMCQQSMRQWWQLYGQTQRIHLQMCSWLWWFDLRNRYVYMYCWFMFNKGDQYEMLSSHIISNLKSVIPWPILLFWRYVYWPNII
jgi:hypothetical protein